MATMLAGTHPGPGEARRPKGFGSATAWFDSPTMKNHSRGMKPGEGRNPWRVTYNKREAPNN